MRKGNIGRTAAALALLTILSGCVAAGRLPPARADAPALDALAFFTGQSRGEGTLKIALRRPRVVTVASVGRRGSNGGLILDQTVALAGQPATQRQWQLNRDGPAGVAGSLSDAAGPVTGRIEGNRLHLRFTMKGGLRADQWLALQPGGLVLHNVMIMRKWGLPVARLDEVITRGEK
ncbi:DUF3833 family protein [Sandarakinorhabdus sp. AAP62]|uniref:DUF3833 family protein n=1 Tax=Sandarakinorhabdus sp. AAP62 TaxID=1248916 RepID=UPI0002EB9799|nr:DUF3833 family protein [Sandarakinorhabdus sp. AAP62]